MLVGGGVEGVETQAGVAFLGIPFARAERFGAPEPVGKPAGGKKATAFGAMAPQNAASSALVRRFTGGGGQSEDCLFLNVWTPAADSARRPVMVWIHGGAFTVGTGGSQLYDGTRLVRRGDVVVVTINYRLGALGFLNTRGVLADDSVVPNAGLLDQIEALRWVRDHIADFGGDPDNVTIFGESAGAMSVGTLLGTPAAAGLFHRAILQSGAAHNVSTEAKAAEVARLYLETLGEHGESAGALRAAPLHTLLRAQLDIARQVGVPLGILPWQPSVDGAVLPQAPLDALRGGAVAAVPAIVGTNRDEWNLFLPGDPRMRNLDEPALRRRFVRTLEVVAPEDRDALVDRAMAHYGPSLGTPLERWCAFQSDRVFHAPAALLARALVEQGAPTFVYRFDWTPPMVGGVTGSFHALEIPFVFGGLRGGFLRATLGITAGARKLSNRMQQAWITWAKQGHASATKLPEWPAFDAESETVMRFATPSGPRERLLTGAADFFADVL